MISLCAFIFFIYCMSHQSQYIRKDPLLFLFMHIFTAFHYRWHLLTLWTKKDSALRESNNSNGEKIERGTTSRLLNINVGTLAQCCGPLSSGNQSRISELNVSADVSIDPSSKHNTSAWRRIVEAKPSRDIKRNIGAARSEKALPMSHVSRKYWCNPGAIYRICIYCIYCNRYIANRSSLRNNANIECKQRDSLSVYTSINLITKDT